jgi:hypothetical protein
MYHPYKILEAYSLPRPLLRLLDATLPNRAAKCRPYRMLAVFLVDDTHSSFTFPLRDTPAFAASFAFA